MISENIAYPFFQIIASIIGISILIGIYYFFTLFEYLQKNNPRILKKVDIVPGPFGLPLSNSISNAQLLFTKIGNEDKKVYKYKLILRIIFYLDMLCFAALIFLIIF